LNLPTTKCSRDIVALLWTFAFLSYLLRVNITAAQQFMARELHLSDMQIGYVFTAFLVGYTVFQLPAGVLGDKFGPRTVLAVSGLSWAVTTFSTGWLPGLVFPGTVLALGSLLVLRFAHGLAEAATYPVAMTAVSDWFPAERHAFINSLIFTGSTLGSACAPPLVANIMDALGWRASFYATAAMPLTLALVWWHRTRGRHHSAIVNADKRNPAWRRLLLNGNLLLLCLSYFLYCYAISIFVYWLFKYMVDVRHLSIINSGWATSMPWLAASLAVPIFGYVSTRMSRRLGVLSARRRVALICLLAAALLMGFGVNAKTVARALLAITVSVALLFSTESSYFSTAIDLAPEDAGGASGLMNLAGNLGGVLSTLLIPILAHAIGWPQALVSGSWFAIAAALLWVFIRRPERARAK
jgi:ACS family glucarate transporter-like MFS transporter